MGQFADLTDAAQASPASATALGARLASETPPDRAAQALQMARRYGLPAGVAETFVDDYKARATMEDNRALLERAPRLQSWVDRNPMRAAAAQDDMPSLAEVERRIAQFGELKAPDPIKPSFSTVASGLFESFTQGFRMMREGARMQAGDMLGLPIEDAQRRYEQARARADASRPEFESSTARGLYGGGESLARMLPSAAAAIALRNPALGLVSAGAQTQTEAYGKYRTRGATAGEAALGSFGEGAVEVATEKIPMGFLVDRFGKAGAKEFLAGMLLREMPTEQVATLLQDAIDTAVANPDKTWGEYFAERPEAAYQTALGVLVQSSFFGAANTVARRLAKDDDRARQAEQTAMAAEELSKLAEASKLRGRDAESFREFVQQVADEEGDAPTEFYIDGETLVKTLDQSGVTMQELEAIAPVVASQLEAAMTGGDVRVPVSEFLTAGEALTAPLVDHLRMTPDGMSRAEAQDYMKEQGDRIQREVEAELQRVDDQAQFRQSIEAVRAEFEAELGKAKRFTADVNRAYADLLANFYGATAARLGMTPQELLAKYRLRVQSQLADGQRVMEQGAPDTPEFRNWFGDSKVVDAQGKPLVVYHGTTQGDIAFAGRERGAYFTSSAKLASGYTQGTFMRGGREGAVYPVYLSLKNPMIIDALGKRNDNIPFPGQEWKPKVFGNLPANAVSVEEAYRRAIASGHDGLIVRNVVDTADIKEKGAGDVYVARSPEQIKSATGNRGTFDPNDPSILNQGGAGFDAWVGDAERVDLGDVHEFKAGEPVVVAALHGTTGDFTSFDNAMANIESDLGGGFYFTNNPADVGENYAGMGPDLTQKIQIEAERLESNDELDPDDAMRIARDKWMANEGLTMPVWVKFENPVVLGGQSETFLTYEENYNEELDEYEEPTGTLLGVIEALREVASDERYVDGDVEQAISDVMEKAAENGGLSAREFIAAAKLSEGLVYVADYESDGKLASTEVLRRAFEAAGFDGFIDTTVNEKFGSESEAARKYDKAMAGMDEDTVHFIAFKPTQIKSRLGNDGSFDADDPNILSQQGENPRAQISLPQSFEAGPAVISLLENADLSSFLHESGHLFLEIQADLAIKIQQQISAGASVTAGERQIVEDMNRLLEWFGVKGVEQASGATGGALDQPAFHGTPHRFDKFTTDAIGTGEGAQAYGWGLYFASKREIAEHYRNTLTPRGPATLERALGVRMDEADALWAGARVIAGDLESNVSARTLVFARSASLRKLEPSALDELIEKAVEVYKAPRGQLYEVEVPEDDSLLLWDKPLSEQPEKVREALERLFASEAADEFVKKTWAQYSGNWARAGKKVYEFLNASDNLANDGSGKAASEALAAVGIRGIKYLDGTSRSAGDGSYNYVIFSGDDVAIRQTFYQGGPEGAPPGPSPQGRTPLETWALMSLEEKRQYHEQFARGFEAYAFEGKAPSLELQSVFQRFRSWLLQVYQTLRNLNVELNDDVRAVMGRMLASDFAIEEAEAARNMGPLFKDAESAGMTLEEFNAYQGLARGATEDAIAQLQARGLKDMRWLSRARDKALKARQQEVEELRREVRQEVRAEVLQEPVYRAWQFLTGRVSDADKVDAPAVRKSVPGPVDNTVDSMFVAIAKMGGLRRDAAAADLGIDPKQRSPIPLFGKPLLLRDGGLTQDAMAERLGEQGYLTLDENGKVDIAEFQEKFQAELRGIKQYSYAKDYADAQGLGADAGLNIEGAERGKLDLGALIERYGPADAKIAKLKALRMTAKAGWDFDAVAENFGFDSGDALVIALTEATPPAETIEARTDQRMLEMFGDITSPQALQRAADEAVHNEARARVIAAELKALQDANSVREDTGKRTKQGRKVTVDVMARAAKDYAQQIIGRLKVREIRPAQYAAAEARNAKLAEKALASGKTDEAAMHKRNQLVNNHATKAAYEAQAEVKQIQAYFRRFEKRPKSVDPGYLDQIDALLERFDFRNASLKAIDRRKSFKAWYDEQVADGLVPDISDELLDEANRKSYKDMTVEELRGLRDAVKNIEHLGKVKNRLLTARDQRTFDAAAEDIAGTVRQFGGKPREVKLEGEKGFRYWLEGVAAMHRKLSSLFRQMDGGRDDGPLYEHIVRPMNERGAWEDSRIEQATVALSKLYAPLLKMRGGLTGTRSKVFIPEINASLTRGGRLAVALNWGNEDNRQRIMAGDKWSDGQVRAILATLTKQELEFVNGVWEFIDSYWPEIAAKEKRVTGIAPEKVKAEPFTVKSADGATVQMRGGYYPLKYDTDRSDRAESQEASQVAKEMMRGAMTRATTRRGHTKERVKEVKRAVRKDLGVITQHVKQVVHDLAWHEWLIDTNRLLRDDRVVGAIREHYGPKVLKTIRDDVAGIATADVLPMTDVDKALLALRSNVSRATMGASITTAFLQPFGLTQSMARIGSGHVLRGAARWMGDAAKFESSLAWIREKSEFMRLRSKTFNRELREVSSAVEGKTAAMRAIDGGLFWLMQKMQLVADVPTWIGQYEKTLAQYPAIDEADESAVARREAEAVAQADRAVIEAQGSGQPKDLSEIQRKYPLLTQFYSYFSVTANLIAEKTATTDFKNPRAVAGWLGDMALLAVIPAILPALLMHLLRGGGDDDEPEEWAKRIAQWQVGYLLGAVVGLREFSGAVQGFDYSGPPVGRIVGDITKAGKQTAQGDVDEPMVLAYVNLLGTALGIPVVQLTRSYRGWKAWDEGEAGPQAILLGPPPKE